MHIRLYVYVCPHTLFLDLHSTFLVFLSRKIGLNYPALPLIEVEVLPVSFAGLLQYTLNLSL